MSKGSFNRTGRLDGIIRREVVEFRESAARLGKCRPMAATSYSCDARMILYKLSKNPSKSPQAPTYVRGRRQRSSKKINTPDLVSPFFDSRMSES